MIASHISLNRFMSMVGLGLLALLLLAVHAVHADQYEAQIRALDSQNDQSRNSISSLLTQAGGYEQALNNLESQIDGLQAELNTSVAKQGNLQSEITQTKDKITTQRKFLGDDIRAMYMDDQLTTIEQLATSKNLSDYVDKEEYRTRVQNKIQAIIGEITTLQEKLQQQKGELDKVVNTQKEQNNYLAAAQGRQQRLLEYNQDQQAGFGQEIASNNTRIAELRTQQAAANARFTGGTTVSGGNSTGSSASGGGGGGYVPGGVCGGGYPGQWCNIPMDSVFDSWGMFNRECVSYAAFKVANSGRHMPGWGWAGKGNAKQWVANASDESPSIPVDRNPRVGDVAISTAGPYGHAMYVESVNGNGTITVSQYNADGVTGSYSVATISLGNLYFIHF